MDSIHEEKNRTALEPFPDLITNSANSGDAWRQTPEQSRLKQKKKLHFQRSRDSISSHASDSGKTLCNDLGPQGSTTSAWRMGMLDGSIPTEAPGSVLLVRNSHISGASADTSPSAFYDHYVKLQTQTLRSSQPRRIPSARKVLLIPEPEVSSNDPLNWSTPKKIALLAITVSLALLLGAMSTMFYDLQDLKGHGVPSLSKRSWSLVTGIFFVGMTISQVLLTPLSVIFGKRLSLLASTLLTAGSLIWMAFSQSVAMLALSRILLGISIGCVEVIIFTINVEVIFLHRRGITLAIYTFSMLAGSCFMPPIARLLVLNTSWRSMLLAVCSFALVVLVLALIAMPETHWDRDTKIQHTAPCGNSRHRANTGKSAKSYFSHCTCYNNEHQDPHPGKLVTYERLSPVAIERRVQEHRRAVLARLQDEEMTKESSETNKDDASTAKSPPLSTPEKSLTSPAPLRSCLPSGPARANSFTHKAVRFPSDIRARSSSAASDPSSPPRSSLSRHSSHRTTSAWQFRPSLRLDLEKVMLDRASVGAITGHTDASGYQNGMYTRGPNTAMSPGLTTAGLDMGFSAGIGACSGTRHVRSSCAPLTSTRYMARLRTRQTISWRSSMKIWHGRIVNEPWTIVAGRPWLLVHRCPVTLLWSACTYAFCVALCMVLPSMIGATTSKDAFKPESFTIQSIAAGVGTLVGALFSGLTIDTLAVSLAWRNSGIFEPEFRLLVLVPTALIGGAGLLSYGILASRSTTSTGVLSLCLGLAGYGCASGAAIALSYAADCFTTSITEVGIVLGVVKNLGPALILALAMSEWREAKSIESTCIVLAVLFVMILIGSGVPMYIFGRRLRVRGARQVIFEQG